MDLDRSFKMAAHVSGPGLARLRGIIPTKWEPIVDTLQTTERLADRAFKAQVGKSRFVVYMEAYSYWVESAPWSMLAKSGLLSERERLPTKALLYVLMPKGYVSQNGELTLKIDDKVSQYLSIEEICFWKLQPELWWTGYPGLMALYPLCNHGQEMRSAVAYAAQEIKQHTVDALVRANLLANLGIFGKLKDPTLDVVSIIGREQMRESPLYQEILDEGAQLYARKNILAVVRARFGKGKEKQFAEPLEAISHLEQLDKLRDIALKCKTLDAFAKSFPKAPASSEPK